MKTYCLVIDDDSQKDYFETEIQRVLIKDNIELEPIFIETKDRKYLKKDHSGINRALIEEDCLAELKKHNCSIIVSDYQIATKDDDFNGLDILVTLSEKYPYQYKILYSGAKIREAIKKISNILSGNPDDIQGEQPVISAIEQLKKSRSIHDLVNGKGYAEKVINYMRCTPLVLQQIFLSQLKDKYPNMVFQSCYPRFKGKTFVEIAEQIEQRTSLGGEFQQALISQTIAYLVEINKDDE